MNMEVVLPEIGPLKDLSYKELTQSLLKVMKESTEVIWLEWEFFLLNSKREKMLIA